MHLYNLIKFALIVFFRTLNKEDAGFYECQISTKVKMSHYVHLIVIGNSKKRTNFLIEIFQKKVFSFQSLVKFLDGVVKLW